MPACTHCKCSFELEEQDRAFLKKVAPAFNNQEFPLPDPEFCPECRLQQRLAWRGELNLFKRKSSYSGKPIITFYPPDAPCSVYTPEEFWSDKWDPCSYGREFDFNRPFFEQFQELLEVAPVLSLTNSQNENCEFINCSAWCKNCYLLAGTNHNEDCYFGNYVNYCTSCVDNNFIDHCELCYECIDCKGCYNLRYSSNCHECRDSSFLYNCRGCKDCFGSVNLVNKQYCYLNEQLTKSQYEEKRAALKLDTRSRVQQAQKYFDAHRLKYPHKFMIGERNDGASGNAINNVKNAHYCFDVSELEDCRYCSWFHQAKDCMDNFAWGMSAEMCYQCMEVGDNSYHVLFSATAFACKEVFYSYCVMNSSNCFGSVGLKRNEYTILNKQYSKEEYQQLVPRIISHMQATGEWGRFFPPDISPLPYNTAITNDYFPLSKDVVNQLGWEWHDFEEEQLPATATPIPDSIQEATDDICRQVLICAETNKPYKVIDQELQFYKTNGIPLPDRSWKARHSARVKRRNPRQLWLRACDKCKKEIRTSFAPERPEIVYCEPCYLSEVY